MIITILRKPLEGTVAENTLKHGCGAIHIDATRVGTEARTYKGMGNKVGNQENADGSSIYWMSKPPTTKSKREGASGNMEFSVEGRWPANFILTHLEGCELRGTKKVKGAISKPSVGNEAKTSISMNNSKEGIHRVSHADEDGKETIADWACVEGCPVQELDRQSGHLKSGKPTGTKKAGSDYHGNFPGGEMTGFGDEGGASRFFKQFKIITDDMVEYFKTLISPPVDEALVLVAKPSEIDYESYLDDDGEGIIPNPTPKVHGVILFDEPTDQEAQKLYSILKHGAHIILIPQDIGYKGVISLEDTGFEVRDAIFVGDGNNDFHYCSKASRSEREAGLKEAGKGKRSNPHPTVKPIDVMAWCARDIEKGSLVLDPFMGSGTTGIAMAKSGYSFIGIEIQEEYAEVSLKRIQHWSPSEDVIFNGEPAKKDMALLGGLFSLFSD